jgi:ribose transport system permease protein
MATASPGTAPRSFFRSLDKAVLIAFAFIFVLLGIGSRFFPQILSANYLLQQAQIATFLGVIASGAMIVILIGHIDLSIPWVVTIGGMMSTAAAGWWGDTGILFAIPFGVLCGALVGVVNGVGVAFLRIPSMIFTLGTNAVCQGLMVIHTGGFAPQDFATPLMRWMVVDRPVLGIPNAVFAWLAVGIAIAVVLRRTPLGRYIYAIGNRERAAYLSGINTRAVIIACFAISGGLAAFAGILLTGYSTKSYQAMGDAYLLPAIAAVVLGGTNIMGGRGTYLGTVAGVILITLLQSILSIMQIEEAGRQVIYGLVILTMLLVYGRSARVGG